MKKKRLQGLVFRMKTKRGVLSKFYLFARGRRFVWNQFLSINLIRLYNGHRIMSYEEMAFWLVRWKSSEERGWLKAVPSQVLQQALMDLHRAFMDAFDRNQPKKRIPRFHGKASHNSFRYPQHFKLDNRRFYLPKIGWVGFFKSRDIPGKMKSLTISRHSDENWYVSVLVEAEVESPVVLNDSYVAIDPGVATFATFSDGTKIESINSFRKYELKLACEQKELKNKKKFSKNWHKQKRKVGKVHFKIKNTRKDHLHKASTATVRKYRLIFFEDSKVSNLIRSASGTIENPGVNVGAKSGLNKSIFDQGWYEFRRQLEYKSSWRGGQVFLVDPRYTSQICSKCGYKDKNNRKSQSKFLCLECGHSENADLNAAKNILKRGLNKFLHPDRLQVICA